MKTRAQSTKGMRPLSFVCLPMRVGLEKPIRLGFGGLYAWN
jgi:hypothetical protein